MSVKKDLEEIAKLEQEIYTEQFFNITSGCVDCKRYRINAENRCDGKDKVCNEFRHK